MSICTLCAYMKMSLRMCFPWFVKETFPYYFREIPYFVFLFISGSHPLFKKIMKLNIHKHNHITAQNGRQLPLASLVIAKS